MQPCDVNGQNCAGQSEDSQLCGSCMRNICDGCAETLTTINDDYGNHYLVPSSLGNEESFGNVSVCPACAHLELFKTTTNTNRNLALEHMLSEHPEGNLEDVSQHGELDDYHDALHYGDVDEETRGVADYPSDHPQDDDANFKVAVRIRGEEANEVGCPHCSNVGLPIVNQSTGERWCSNCSNSLPPTPTEEPAEEPKATSNPNPKTFVPAASGLLVPGGTAPTAPPSGGPVAQPKQSPLFVPIEPKTDPSQYPPELHPDTPLDISSALASIQQANPLEGSAGAEGAVPKNHPYANHRTPVGWMSNKMKKRFNSGNLSDLELAAVNAGKPIGKITKKELNKFSESIGGLTGEGKPVHGISEEHFDCEKQGGTKLIGPGMVCHSCGKSVKEKYNHEINDYEISLSRLSPSSNHLVVSPYDSEIEQSKATAIIDLHRRQHGRYADIKEEARTMEINPQTGEKRKKKRDRAGRPAFEERASDFVGFTPPEPTSGTYKFHNNGQKVAHRELSEDDIERAYRASVKPHDFDSSTAHVHTTEGRLILEDGTLIDSTSTYGQKKQ